MRRIYRSFLFLPVFLLLNQLINAQSFCATDEVHRHLLRTNSIYKKNIELQNTKWQQYRKKNAGVVNRPGTTDNILYQIPVVIHVIHTGQELGSVYNPSDATLFALIDELNQKYAATWPSYPGVGSGGVNVPIRFKLAQRTPDCQPSNGINRVNGSTLPGYGDYGVAYTTNDPGAPDLAVKALSIWPNTSYMNIWIVTDIKGTTPGGGSIAGYATYPGTMGSLDGIVLRADQTNWALAHEAGHYLGLSHTFTGSDNATTCPPNNDCTTDGDQICDTDPHPLVFGCPIGTNTCTGMPYAPVVYNIMNYTSCPDRFTAGQADRMVFMLENYRSSLLTSRGGLPPGINGTIISSPPASCLPAGILYPGYDIGPLNVVVSDMQFSGYGNSGDNSQYYIDRTLANCLQSQPVAHLNRGNTYTIAVTTGYNRENVRGWIDFNKDGIFQSSELIISSDGTTAPQTHTGSFTVPANGIANCTTLRMRIMSDFAEGNPPPEPCSLLLYGQAEDFIVIIQNPAMPAPSVSIAPNKTNLICEGTSVIFTASPVNGGNNPAYQWKKNGTNAGVNSSNYTANGLVNGDIISCVMTPSVACPAYSVVASNTVIMSVSPSPPSVGVTATPAGMVCKGATILFKANPVNGGSSPAYQWKKNGINSGTNSDTYSSNSLANGDVISCVMTISETCPATQSAASNTITVAVSSPPPGTVITPSPVVACLPEGNLSSGYDAGPLNVALADMQMVSQGSYSDKYYIDHTLPAMPTCFPLVAHLKSGNSYTITVTTGPHLENVRGWIDFSNDGIFQPSELVISSDGSTIYQTHSSSFTVPGGGIATCTSLRMRIMSDLAEGNPPPGPCSRLLYGQAEDFIVVIQEPTSVVPSVSISVSQNIICEGASVTFTADPANGGNNPIYRWRLNGNNVGTNSNTYSSSTFKTGDVVYCVMTSSQLGTCNPTVTSNSISMSITPVVTPTVSIISNVDGPICAGTNVTFTAIPIQGNLPSFQWKVNGSVVGRNRDVYTTNTLTNGDIVSCEMISPYPCVSSPKAISNTITMIVHPVVIPSVTIVANTAGSICSGTNVIFTATPTNGGNPIYQWKLNGNNVGTNNSSYSSNTLTNGDVVSCVLTSSNLCTTTPIATSNSINISVITGVTPSVSISSNVGGAICAGTSVTFTATAINEGINPKYQWKVGNAQVGTNSSTYTTNNLTNGAVVTCVLTSNSACVSNASITSPAIIMSVSSPPLATIAAAGPLTFCTGKNVLLKAITGTGYTYQWKKSGVNIDNATQSAYTATVAGIYSVVVSNATGCSATSAAINVIVNAVPLATVAAASPLTFCEGKSVQLKAITGTGYTYQWKRGGADITGAVLSNYTATTTGIYTAIVTNAGGCSTTSAAFTVVVKPLPLAVITPVGSTTFCSGKNVLLKANTGTSYTYQWIRGATVIPDATQSSYAATTPGQYTLIVTNASGCSVTSTAIPVSVTPLPAALITPAGPPTFCTGQSVSLKANTGTNYTYQWKKAGVNIPDATLVSYTASASGVYSVVVTNAAGCSVVSPGVTVTVNSVPLATVVAASATSFCAGKSVLLKAINATGYTYQWKKNAVSIPHDTTSNYTATATGVYSVVVTNATGCSTTSIGIGVTVTMAPLATVAIAGPVTFCEGKNVLLKAIAAPGYIYQWKKNGVNIAGQTQSNYTATATGVYTVMVTNAEGCSTLSTDINVTVTPAPAAIITANGPLTFPQGGNVMLNAPAADGNVYQWKKDGINITGATSESYAATAGGSYTVVVTNASGCQAVSLPVQVSVISGGLITKGLLNAEESVKVYPNPLYRSEYLNIEWSLLNVERGLQVTVFDITGRKIDSRFLKPYDKKIRIKGASGVYVVEVRWGKNERKIFQVIKIE